MPCNLHGLTSSPLSTSNWLGVMVLGMHWVETSADGLLGIHLVLVVELPSLHRDCLEHLFSTPHHPHRGLSSIMHPKQSSLEEHSSIGILMTCDRERYYHVIIALWKRPLPESQLLPWQSLILPSNLMPSLVMRMISHQKH